MKSLNDIKPLHKTYLVIITLFILGFISYSNILYAPFVFDDRTYIADNYLLRDISNFLKDFSGTRYIGFLSFALNYYFDGLNPFGYHLVNIIIHILNAILVYFLVILTFSVLSLRGALAPKQSQSEIASALPRNDIAPNLIAFSVSLIFLVHPIQTQSVSYITQRFTSLAAFFYLLALVLYVKYRQWAIGNGQLEKPITYRLSPIAYCLSLLSTILAMKTKEISFTLPFMIILYEFTFFERFERFERLERLERFKRFLYLIPFLMTLLIIPLELFLGNSPIELGLKKAQWRDLTELSNYNYLITQFRVIVTYMRLIFLPINQSLNYDYPVSKSIFEPSTLLSFLFLFTILGFAIYLYIRSRKTDNGHGILISFGILWFFITLSVESSIIPIKDVIFEHRLYLPSIGFILSAVVSTFYGFEYLENKINKSLSKHILSFIAVIIISLLFALHSRNAVWENAISIWEDVVKKSPEKEAGHNHLGSAYYNQGRIDEAIKEYLTAVRLNPDFADAHNNLGLAYAGQGRLDEAIKEYLIALKLDPNNIYTHYNLGDIYSSQKRFKEAEKEYLITLKLNPEYASAHNNLGILYFSQGRFDEALNEYGIVLKLEPKFSQAYNNIGNIYFLQGRLDEAIKGYLFALRLDPTFAAAHYNLGVVYKMKGLKDEAKKEFEIVLKLNPNHPEAKRAMESLGFRVQTP